MNYLDAIKENQWCIASASELAERAVAICVISYAGDVLARIPVKFVAQEGGYCNLQPTEGSVEKSGVPAYLIFIDAQNALVHIEPANGEFRLSTNHITKDDVIDFSGGIRLEEEYQERGFGSLE